MAEVAVLGMGNLGSAIASRLVAVGRDVVVWNRTPERCRPLVALGAEAEPTPGAAIGAADVVISVVLDYDALRAILADVPDLSGRTFVNLSWGSPEQAEEAAGWVEARGGRYLEGGVLCRPQDIGTPLGEILYAGASDLFSGVRPLLAELGPQNHVGAGISHANALALALGSMFYTGVLSFLEAAAYADRMGIPVDVVGPLARIPLVLAAATSEAAAEQVVTGDFEASQATNDVHAAALKEVASAFAASGIGHLVVDAALVYFDAGARRGLGGKEISAMFQVVSDADGAGSG